MLVFSQRCGLPRVSKVRKPDTRAHLLERRPTLVVGEDNVCLSVVSVRQSATNVVSVSVDVCERNHPKLKYEELILTIFSGSSREFFVFCNVLPISHIC